MKFKTPSGATPIVAQDLEGLKPHSISNQGELNEAENENIIKARLWAPSSRILKKELLTWKGLSELHKRMFSDVWIWAGKPRVRETSIGVPPELIFEQLKLLLDDVSYWIKNKNESGEIIGVKFHHRLVLVHPFVNGNGRHARFAAELLIQQLGGKPPSWVEGKLSYDNQSREHYLKALRLADKGDYSLLIDFSYQE